MDAGADVPHCAVGVGLCKKENTKTRDYEGRLCGLCYVCCVAKLSEPHFLKKDAAAGVGRVERVGVERKKGERKKGSEVRE